MYPAEVGRELKVSELKPRTVVCLHKGDQPFISTMWVVEVLGHLIHFKAGTIGMHFFALRTGEDLESITDDSGIPMKIYEYLGG